MVSNLAVAIWLLKMVGAETKCRNLVCRFGTMALEPELLRLRGAGRVSAVSSSDARRESCERRTALETRGFTGAFGCIGVRFVVAAF